MAVGPLQWVSVQDRILYYTTSTIHEGEPVTDLEGLHVKTDFSLDFDVAIITISLSIPSHLSMSSTSFIHF